MGSGLAEAVVAPVPLAESEDLVHDHADEPSGNENEMQVGEEVGDHLSPLWNSSEKCPAMKQSSGAQIARTRITVMLSPCVHAVRLYNGVFGCSLHSSPHARASHHRRNMRHSGFWRCCAALW